MIFHSYLSLPEGTPIKRSTQILGRFSVHHVAPQRAAHRLARLGVSAPALGRARLLRRHVGGVGEPTVAQQR